MKVKQLTNELLNEILEKMNTSSGNETNQSNDIPRVLTSSYVSQFNKGVSYRIQQREASHAASADLAAKARFH